MSAARHRRTSRALAAALAVATLAIAGCGGGATPPKVDDRVELKDFKITVSTHRVHAGTVVFGLRNVGPTVHEMVLVRTDLPAAHLPIGRDGLSIDEDSKRLKAVDEVPEVRLAESGHLTVKVRPGHYVLFCNLPGHYLGGMHADVEVTA